MSVIRKTVSSSKLKQCCVYTLDGMLPDEGKVLFTGTAYTPNSEPLAHSAVVINQYDKIHDPPLFINQSVTFTDEFGNYALLVPFDSNYIYEFKAFGQ